MRETPTLVLCLSVHSQVPNTELAVQDLIELFRRIDVDASDSVDWDEFTSYCVQSGVGMSHPHGTSAGVLVR